MESRMNEKPPCLKILDEHDPECGKIFEQLFNTTFSPGALDVNSRC